MHSRFDRRVLSDQELAFVRACQERVPCHLAGGAALSGAYLSHRLSADIDLFCHDAAQVRDLFSLLPTIAQETSASVRIVRDSGTHVRAELRVEDRAMELDLVHEALPDLEPAPTLEAVTVESFPDLRASKLTCLLSRSEPRDLVDLLFLERRGYLPENDLALALRKDAGIDPGVLAWLLRDFPVEPLPTMLEPLTVAELRDYRDRLAQRFRELAVAPAGPP